MTACFPISRTANLLSAVLAATLMAGCMSPPSTPTATASASASASASTPPSTMQQPAPAAAAPATAPAAPLPAPDSADIPPPAPREFRAAWIASVANIDWPSKPGLPAQTQRDEALRMLERARTLGLNALILQVRPAGDALYPSALEPWSEYLSGEQGRAPQPPYDPLAFWVQEAHRRGIELHVWLNPYRARHSSAKTPLVAPHLALRSPTAVKRYGDMQWMDPGEPAAVAQTLAVVADILKRYDIDGLHIDDYFYPYPVAVQGVDQPFPDAESYARHRAGGGTLLLEDWRRANVDALVQRMHQTVRQIKPQVRFGISPFGLGRPDRRPAGVTGFSQYDKLYADVELWLEKGWLDYLAPQLYWPIARQGQPFGPLLDYWVTQNTADRHVWPGLFTSQVTRSEALGPRSWPAQEILDQVGMQRQRGAAATGHIHFSMIALMHDRDGVAAKLQAGPYAQPALVPASPWLDDQPPPAPTLRRAGAVVHIEPGAGEAAARWALWRREAGRWRFEVLPAAQRQIAVSGAQMLGISAVDRVGNLSAQHLIALP